MNNKKIGNEIRYNEASKQYIKLYKAQIIYRTFYVGMYCTRATQMDDYRYTKQLNYGVEVINVEVARKTQLIRKRAETDHRRVEPMQRRKHHGNKADSGSRPPATD